jgi:hypothetical protein
MDLNPVGVQGVRRGRRVNRVDRLIREAITFLDGVKAYDLMKNCGLLVLSGCKHLLLYLHELELRSMVVAVAERSPVSIGQL